MSGGHFDYAYSRVQTFTEELDREIGRNGEVSADSLQTTEFPAEVIEALRAISAHANLSARLMKAAEWLYEGDTSPESFLKEFREIIQS